MCKRDKNADGVITRLGGTQNEPICMHWWDSPSHFYLYPVPCYCLRLGLHQSFPSSVLDSTFSFFIRSRHSAQNLPTVLSRIVLFPFPFFFFISLPSWFYFGDFIFYFLQFQIFLTNGYESEEIRYKVKIESMDLRDKGGAFL